MQNLNAIGPVVSELLSVKDRLVGPGRAGPGRAGSPRISILYAKTNIFCSIHHISKTLSSRDTRFFFVQYVVWKNSLATSRASPAPSLRSQQWE